MILVLDNYDSFTYNLVQTVAALGAKVRVVRNDRIGPEDVLALAPRGLILSPGPGRPEAAGRMPEIFAAALGLLPILGVCLGHQMIAQHFGGQLKPASRLVHGKASWIRHDGQGVLRGLPDPFVAGRYHSLAVEPASVPECLQVSAQSEDGEIMGLRHKELPIEGVQFHPESVLTPCGATVIGNFLTMVNAHGQLASHTILDSRRPGWRQDGCSSS